MGNVNIIKLDREPWARRRRAFLPSAAEGEEAGPKGGGTCAGSVQKWMKSYRLIVADRPHLVSVFEY
jgi:hypothetical protein